MGVSLTGPVNAQRAQWGCRYIPVNAQGDQLDCTVSGGKPGVQWDCVVCACVCMTDVGRLGCVIVLTDIHEIFEIRGFWCYNDPDLFSNENLWDTHYQFSIKTLLSKSI